MPNKKDIENAQISDLEEFVADITHGQKAPRIYALKELFKAALKLARESPGTLNLKIAATVMKELRYSFKMFYPDRYSKKITIFGSARVEKDDPTYLLARDFAAEASKRDYMIITGGGPGVMAAGNEGALNKKSFGLNIRLPFEQSANEHIDPDTKLLNYKYFFTRKLFLVKEASALALFPGGFGTMDEAFEVLTLIQTGKSSLIPIVMMEPPGETYWGAFLDFVNSELLPRKLIGESDKHLYKTFNTPKEAVDHIDHFYLNYHSMRLVRNNLVIRYKKALSQEKLKEFEEKFGSASLSGKFEQGGPLPEERNESELNDLIRLVFPFDRHDFSGLRLLIDFINDCAV